MTRKLLLYSISAITLAFDYQVFANTNDTISSRRFPGYMKIQYAGNLGLVSVGIGTRLFHEKLTLGITYGYLPKWINGVRVHTIALKSAYHFSGFNISTLQTGYYFGTAIAYGIARNTYVSFPGYYPDNYYNTNAIHINPFIGMRINLPVQRHKIKSLSLFTELGTIDYQIWYAIKNNQIGISDIWNLSFGIAFILK